MLRTTRRTRPNRALLVSAVVVGACLTAGCATTSDSTLGAGGTSTTPPPATAPATATGTSPTTSRSTTAQDPPGIPVPAPPDTAPGAPDAPTREVPPLPPGGRDCGTDNLMSGWPTTFAHRQGLVDECLAGALAAGTPARLVYIFASDVDRGRRTPDGYAIPAATVTSYVVLGPNRLQVTVDERESGGPRTVQDCTGLAPDPAAVLPQPTGCTPT